jgi:predicted DCC family thiol-disulfide oxidoreductase YuxK
MARNETCPLECAGGRSKEGPNLETSAACYTSPNKRPQATFSRIRQPTGWLTLEPRTVSREARGDDSSETSAIDPVRRVCNPVQRLGEIPSPARFSRHFPLRRAAVADRSGDNRRAPERRKPVSSVILFEDNSIYTESDAVLQILARLSPPWPWIALLRIIPCPARDACYRFIVSHRYQWFGRTEARQIPSVDVRSRFVE